MLDDESEARREPTSAQQWQPREILFPGEIVPQSEEKTSQKKPGARTTHAPFDESQPVAAYGTWDEEFSEVCVAAALWSLVSLHQKHGIDHGQQRGWTAGRTYPVRSLVVTRCASPSPATRRCVALQFGPSSIQHQHSASAFST
ncbi:hypothetical protein QQS21_007214 [Conoideocrella luteorostrata]|uniref:Uncharacterized protein n=1 Tax=Conoideocrella luteorostrata TaxID=1105319 RepID=A0AAJ0CNK7_9HYPO|nr:hypothetical protein QQS21_007214 [Conoideocrella luteorostrata]